MAVPNDIARRWLEPILAVLAPAEAQRRRVSPEIRSAYRTEIEQRYGRRAHLSYAVFLVLGFVYTVIETKPNGLGLGLGISRSIVEAHGGQLLATADTASGTTFHFTLPLQHRPV